MSSQISYTECQVLFGNFFLYFKCFHIWRGQIVAERFFGGYLECTSIVIQSMCVSLVESFCRLGVVDALRQLLFADRERLWFELKSKIRCRFSHQSLLLSIVSLKVLIGFGVFSVSQNVDWSDIQAVYRSATRHSSTHTHRDVCVSSHFQNCFALVWISFVRIRVLIFWVCIAPCEVPFDMKHFNHNQQRTCREEEN